MKLITNPSVENWYEELGNIFSSGRSLAIKKLGSPAGYIRNLIANSTEPENSQECFLQAFSKYVRENSFADISSINTMLSICSDFELFSYLENIIDLLDMDTISECDLLSKRNKLYFDFCIYIKEIVLKTDITADDIPGGKLIRFIKKLQSITPAITAITIYTSLIMDSDSHVEFYDKEVAKKLLHYILKTPQHKITPAISNAWGYMGALPDFDFDLIHSKNNWTVNSNSKGVHNNNFDEISFETMDTQIWDKILKFRGRIKPEAKFRNTITLLGQK